MSIFSIDDIREKILSYVYPTEVTVGMTILVYKSSFHPFLTNTSSIIKSIKKKNNEYQVITMTEELKSTDNWYRVYTYFYPNSGDTLKVIKY